MDKYHVLELIGEGQFGKVYKGRRKFGSQTVALKFIGKKGKSEKELGALRQEMHILASLTGCAYVIRMLDWFETASEICVVTEYAQGELFEILEDDTALPEDTVRRIAVQLVAGLRYLHAHRIIHRDMKPQNILIGACGTLKVADFGFARSMSANTSLLTSVKGTPLYMAPELVRSMPYNHTTDLWSLGVILYELAVGQPPFFTNSFYTLVHLIVDTPVVYPPSMSEEFKSFLQGLLHKSPSKRLTWPQLQSHPFLRESPEEEQKRTEAANKGNGSIAMLRPITAGGASLPPSARHTPRADGQQPTGLGGAALPPKPQSVAHASAGPPPPHPGQPASRTASHTARANAAAAGASHVAAAAAPRAVAAAAAVAAPAPAPAAAPPSSNIGGMEGGHDEVETRSRSGSAELDLHQLPHLLSPAYADSIRDTLQQLTGLLQRAASSPQLPSPLLDVYPTLLEQQVPSQLCRLLVSAAGGSHSPAIEYSTLLPLVLQLLVAMLQPNGGRVAPMPLYTTDAEGSGAANAATPHAGGRSGLRAAAGRAPPNYELQLRRQLAECICTPIEGAKSSGTHGAFSLLAAATRAACKETATTLSTRGEPSSLLSSLVIVLFQCTRACVASGTAAAAGGGGASASNAAAGGDLLDCLSGDVQLLSSLLSTLHACASGLAADEVSDRSRLAGRLLLFFANLCGKQPAVVKVLVQQCAFDASSVLAHMRREAAPMLALPASFLLSQLLTNPHARLEAHVANPLPLLHLVTHWMQTPAMPANPPGSGSGAPHATTLLVELEGSGVGYSLIGSHDGLLQLLQALVYFHQLQSNTPKAALIARDAIAPSEQFLTGTVWSLLLARLERLDQQQQRSSGPTQPGSNGASGAAIPSSFDIHAFGELSVLGWMSFLSLMLDLLKMHSKMSSARPPSSQGQDGGGSGPSLMSESLFRCMCTLLSPVRVGALYAWPEACGGGSVGVALLLKRALGILYVPFNLRSSARDDEVIQARVQKCLFHAAFIRRLLSACRLLELPAQLEAPLGFLAHLTMRNEHFEKQMLDNGGLALLANKQLLNPAPRVAMVPAANGAPAAPGAGGGGAAAGPALVRVHVTPSPSLLTDALNIVSNLARSSAAHYAPIHSANLYASLCALLSHPDGGVRGKTCNLLGNLCRHSAFFYPHLAAAGLLPPLVERCSDPEPHVRKWAAFALGNAVFYDASLCPLVVPAIPALLRLLRASTEPASAGAASNSDRTMQNAAGVLTNMLRHGVAAHDMIEQGAVETLLDLLLDACEDEQGRARSQPTPLQTQCARSALFTLGDLAAFRSARRILHQRQAVDVVQRVAAASADPKLKSYSQRLLARYNAPPQG